MTTLIQNRDVRTISAGLAVSRTAATIPQTAAQNIFTITGGRILLVALIGTVTTVIGGTATTVKVTNTPAAGNSGTTSGVRTCGEGNGFRLSAPATTNPMRLRLYLGVSGATGLLKLKLSSGGKTVTTEMTQRGSSLETAKYTIDYQATKAGKISIEWITDESFAADCGGVALQAATLF